MPIPRPDLSARVPSLTLERTMQAPPEVLYRAWTTEAGTHGAHARWLCR